MKKRISKKRIYLLFILVIAGLKIIAQQPWTCSTIDTNRALSHPGGICSDQFLNDLKPDVNSDSIEIYVKVQIFVPTTGSNSSVWHNTNYTPSTYTDAVTLINDANHYLRNIVATPNLMGVTSFTNAKIKLVLYSFSFIEDDVVFQSIGTSPNIDPYVEDHAINVFFSGWEQLSNYNPTGSGNGNVPCVYPYNMIIFHPTTNTTSNAAWDNIKFYGNTLVHEMGHILGLKHSDSDILKGGGYSFITPGFGCCHGAVTATDYVLETPANNTQGSHPITNNFMSANSYGIYLEYLSPQQMAVMHYNLRTTQKQFLTSAGYNAATSANAAFDYSVTSNETWTTDRYFKGNITVKAGKTLTVKCGLAMTYGAKITVEKTALLVVDGGTITNISGRTWDGIYVTGDPAQSEAISSGMPVYQGMAKFINGAVISHAQRAVKNYLNPISSFGGIIIAANSSFINNYMDVDFRDPTANSSNATTICKFYSCNFKTDGVIGDNLFPSVHVNLDGFSGTWFYGCNFEYAAGTIYNDGGCGIKSVNSIFSVDKNGGTATSFIGLDRGVFVNNTNLLFPATISNCNFVDNTGYGAYFMNVNYLSFKNNFIQNPGYIAANAGVYLNTCKYYTVKNNTFLEDLNYNYKASPGLEIYNSGTGVHQVYKNSFSNLSLGINTMGDNSGTSNFMDGLKMNCNDFTQTSNVYDIALDLGLSSEAPSVMTNQGETNPLVVNSTNVVRNMYAATCNNNDGNKWYIHSSSNKIINHGSNSSSVNGEITKPSPQTACSRTIINIVDLNTAMDYTAVCSINPPSSGGTSTSSSNSLASMNDYITDLKGLTDLGDDGNVVNHFEIQATTASKLNVFLTDTVNQNIDSVVAIIQNNQGAMEDADLQTVFVYMYKGDYTTAQDKVNNLSDARSDWAALLTRLITVELSTDGLSNLNDDDRAFFLDYATTDNKDGQSLAQAILKYSCDSSYTEPHNYPEGSGFRKAHQQAQNIETALSPDQPIIKIYPNPAQTGITVYYSAKVEGSVKIELRDLVGKLIYTNFINGGTNNQYIDMREFNNGMYLITINRSKEVIYKTKIIKEN